MDPGGNPFGLEIIGQFLAPGDLETVDMEDMESLVPEFGTFHSGDS
jgi:hypothetical protein